MTEERRTPNLNTFIAVAGFVLTAGLIVVRGGAMFAQVETQIAQQAQIIGEMRAGAAAREQRLTAVERVAAAAAEAAAQDARRLVEIEARMRTAETTTARIDERFLSLQADVRRLIALVERIERNGGYQQP